MKRRVFLRMIGAAATLAVLPAFAARAEIIGDQIAQQLRRRGYSDIAVSRTLLGRVRITAERGGSRREIIVNPSSGEILRDMVTDRRTGRASSSVFDGDRGSSSSGSGSRTSGSNDNHNNDDDGGGEGGGGSSSGSSGGDSGGDGDDSGGDDGGSDSGGDDSDD